MDTLSLDNVEQAFNQWRQNRRSARAHIPLKLWRMAAELYPRYKKSHICKRLHLSGSQFKQKLTAGSHANNMATGFIVATPQVPILLEASEERQATLTVQGKNRALSLKLSVVDLPKVLPLVEAFL